MAESTKLRILTNVITTAKGFTLIELVAVISILAILSVVTVIKIPDFAPSKLNIANDNTIIDLKIIRDMAINQKKVLGIKFDLNNESYSVYEGDHNFSNIITNISTDTAFTVDFGTKFPGISLLSTSLAGDFVQYDSQGIPYDDNGALVSTANLILKQSITNSEKTIMVIPKTGFATN